MGVEARVVLFAVDEALARAAAERAFRRIHALDEALSDWRADSELALLVLRAGEGPIEVSEDLFQALRRALELAELTGGAFDPTVAPLVREWRAWAARGGERDREAWEEARRRVGRRRVTLEGATWRVALEAGTELDLGAIGKGFACDEALAELAAAGFEQALVELGGDLALGAPPPGAEGWVVLAGGNSDASPRRLVLARCGVATSGGRERSISSGGRRLSHVIDPRTGEPVAAELGMTVVARDATAADALASAACVLGRYEGGELVARAGGRLHVDDPRLVPLFDGATLACWTTRGGRYDGDARWTVEEGALVGRPGPRGEGGLLYTERSYAAFELELEVRMSWPFDSGIFARMRPPETGQRGVQLTLDAREGGEIGALYADGFLAHQPDGMRHWKLDEWNHVLLRVSGFDPRVEAWLNGARVADWDASPTGEAPAGVPFAFAGLIGLQVHDVSEGADRESAVRFRDLRLRELPILGEAPFEKRGFSPLLALGEADPLRRFEVHGAREGYTLEGGLLRFPASGEAGHLATKEDFQDFLLRLDFQLAEMANSGLFLRAARDGSNPAYSGCEIQILDDFHWEERTGTKLAPWQLSGSLYGALAPSEQALRPIGEWNRFEILYRGPRLAVALNGRLLYDVDTLALEVEPPFARRAAQGFLGLQRYALPERTAEHALSFRDLYLKPIASR